MFTTLVAIGIIALQIFLVILVVGWLIKAPFIDWVSRNASWLLRIIFVGSAVGSLIFEYAYSFAPCILCWYQRIAIFGIALLLFTADIKRSWLLRLQVIVFSSIGIAFALFHNYIDLFPSSGLDVCGTGPSCLARYIYEFGYITIPMMSLTVLLSGLLVTLLISRYPHEPVENTRA